MGKVWDNVKWGIQNVKNIKAIASMIFLVLPLGGTAFGWYSDNITKTSQIESGNHAVAELNKFIVENEDKLVPKSIHKTTVIRQGCGRRCDEMQSEINFLKEHH